MTRARLPLRLALAGALTGVLNARLLDGGETITQFLGVIYGLPVAVLLVLAGLTGRIGAGALVIAFGLSWRLAVELAIRIDGTDSLPLALTGVAAGALGAGIVAAGLWLAVPAARNKPGLALLVAAGAALGALLGFDMAYVLLPAWQAGTALVTGLVLQRGRRTSA